ncbi:MAG: hypothetical protein GX856_11510, partial [Gammaproteobacteria bacterium]|nr:hypothetical protein [Gammaproteobacteria bacterium]
VPTEDLVTDVRLQPNPNEDNLNRIRRAREEHGAGPEYAQAMHDEGVKIGEAELKRQLDEGLISERSYNIQLKRLRAPEAGRAVARKYALDASKGKFDGASVTERRALAKRAEDEIDTDAKREEDEAFGRDEGRSADEMSKAGLSSARAGVDVANVDVGLPGVNPGTSRRGVSKFHKQQGEKTKPVAREKGRELQAGPAPRPRTKTARKEAARARKRAAAETKVMREASGLKDRRPLPPAAKPAAAKPPEVGGPSSARTGVLKAASVKWLPQGAPASTVGLRERALARIERQINAALLERDRARSAAAREAAGRATPAQMRALRDLDRLHKAILSTAQGRALRPEAANVIGRLEQASAETNRLVADRRGTAAIDRAADAAEARAKARAKADDGHAEQDVDTIANSTGSAHDLRKEEAMLNAKLKAMGIKDPIRLHSTLDAKKVLGRALPVSDAGRYLKDGSIFISPDLHGAERVEVLAHELGHHIVYSQALSAAGIPFSENVNISHRRAIALMRKHNRALYDALAKDYRAWLAANPPSMRVGDSRATRAPFHRASSFLAQALAHPDVTVGGMSAEYQAYHYNAHEWMADNIARALTTNPKATDIIGQFFKGIADRLKLVYNSLFGTPQAKKMAPAPSVEAWINSLFDADTNAVTAALGRPVSKAQAQTSIRAAVESRLAAAWRAVAGSVPPPRGPEGPGGGRWDPSGDEMAAFIRDVMPKEERQILDRVFNRAAVVKKLRKFYEHSPEALKALDDASQGLENRIAAGYYAWQMGAFDLTPGAANAFWGLGGDLASVFNLAGDGTYAVRILNDMSNGAIQRFHDLGKTYSVKQLEARARGTRQQVYDRFGDAKDAIARPFARFMDSKMRRMWDAGVPALREVAAFIQRPQGTTGEDRGMTPAVVHTTARFADRASRIVGDLSKKEATRTMDMMQRQLRPGDAGWVGGEKVQKAVKDLDRLFRGAHAYMKRAGLDVGTRERFFPIVFDIRNDQVKTRLTEIYSQPKFDLAIRNTFEKLGVKDAHERPIEDLIKNLVDGAMGSGRAAPATGDNAP